MKKVIGLTLFTMFFGMLTLAFYAIWAGNIYDGFTNVCCIAACVLFVLLVLFARPKTWAGRLRLVIVCLFLCAQIGMKGYSVYIKSQYFSILNGELAVTQEDMDESRCFIVREYENGKRRLIYATPGDPTRCAWYVIAEPDVMYDSTVYGVRNKVNANAYSSMCTLYWTSTGEKVDAKNVKCSFPPTIKRSEKPEFHPTNSDLSEEVTAWMKNR